MRNLAQLLVLLGVLLLVFPVGMEASQPIPEYNVYLPTVLFGGEVPCAEPRVYDYDGVEVDWAWLEENFGAVWIEPGSRSACVTELHAINNGDNTLIIRVVDAQDQPVSGMNVVFYYSTAPLLPPDLVGCFDRGDYAPTKSPPDPAAGTVGFGMYGGAYYFPPDGGPHTVWVGVPGSDCLHGIGMLGGTNHYHLNPTFKVYR